MVKVWREHKQWITNIHMQRGGVRELISGSRNGEVRLWDLRMDVPIDKINATKDTLRTLSVHEHAPIFTMYVPVLLCTTMLCNLAPSVFSALLGLLQV